MLENSGATGESGFDLSLRGERQRELEKGRERERERERDRGRGSYNSSMVSAVWQYCTRLPNNGVKCNVCARVMAFHGTTNLRVHIGRHFGIKPTKQRLLALGMDKNHAHRSVPQQKGAVQAGQMKPLVVTPQDPLSLPKAPLKNATPPSATATSTPSRAASASPAPAPSVAPLAPIPLTVAPPVVPEICLRWDSYNKNMRNMFPVLLSNERFCDVTLACEGRSIKCHKFMLSACSPYFDQLLGDNPCRHPIVLLKDLQFWEVQAILDFIYKGEVRVRQNKLPQLLAAASCLQIKGLSETVASSPTPNENCDKNTRNDRNDKNDNNSAGLVKPTSHKELKGAQKRKSPPTCSSDSMASTSVDDSDSESEADEQSRLIVVRNSIDEADSTSSGIPTTNGTIIKKIKLEHPSSASCSDSKDQKNCVTEPANPGISVKKKTGNPPNLIKIEHPIITKQEPPEDYENEWKDDGSSSPSYYPDYPEAIVDTVLTEEDASNQ
ncbi:uncharacterized protein [Bemisia tabaci]|uniref:uncharacterized protein isoform X2 n=1 Tax=Bemisia tabaci TaxID=7038 RepID=UPI003B27E551